MDARLHKLHGHYEFDDVWVSGLIPDSPDCRTGSFSGWFDIYDDGSFQTVWLTVQQSDGALGEKAFHWPFPSAFERRLIDGLSERYRHVILQHVADHRRIERARDPGPSKAQRL